MILKVKDENGQFKEVVLKGLKGDKGDKGDPADQEQINIINETLNNKVDIGELEAEITRINNLNNNIEKIKSNVIYMSDFPSDTNDYSQILQQVVNEVKHVTIICESGKEYVFKTPIEVHGRLDIIGNGATWVYTGNDGTKFITYKEAPWMLEGGTVQGLNFKCGKEQIPYQNKTAVEIQSNHVILKFRDCRFYNFGYCIKMHKSPNGHTFGHSIIDCSFWGFINAIISYGNAEQVLIKHCWIDDGLRTSNSQNAAIKMTDVSSFWIESTVIQNCDIGIAVNGGYNVSIRDNHFENMIDSSIWFYPNSVYENRNCMVDSNFICGGKAGVKFLPSQDRTSVHCTFINNYCSYLGDNAKHFFFATNTRACDYGTFINNSYSPTLQANGKLMMNSNITNCMTGFQIP